MHLYPGEKGISKRTLLIFQFIIYGNEKNQVPWNDSHRLLHIDPPSHLSQAVEGGEQETDLRAPDGG